MRRRLAVAVTIAAVAPAAALALQLAAGPDPNAQAQADGCARAGVPLSLRQVPEWAYVGDKDAPASAPPPPPRWLSGAVNARYDPSAAAAPANIDNPFTHLSYDEGIDVRPDGAYAGLVGGDQAARTGNFAGHGDETARLHVEWEQRSLPLWAWPEPQDRLTVFGSWVWDCGHFTSGERTELHPPSELWLVRHGLSPRSRAGEREGDLVVSNDSTPAFRQAQCAHQTKGNAAAFHGCVLTPGADRPPLTPNRFFLPAPSRPSAHAHMTVRVVDRGSVGRFRFRIDRAVGGVSVGFAPLGGGRIVVGRQVFVGWSPAPRPVHLRLRFLRLHVRDPLDPTSLRKDQVTTAPGEWLVYWDVAGIWRMWKPLVLLVNAGQTVRGQQAVDFFVRPNARWRLAVWTRECDFGAAGNAYSTATPIYPCPRTSEFGDFIGDDDPGPVLVTGSTHGRSLGRHTVNASLRDSTCPPSNRRGCYSLTYTVSRVR